MKTILSYWISFFILFFGTVYLGYSLSIPTDNIIVTLLLLYYVFQGFSLYRGFRRNHNWFVSSVIIQAMFAVASPLYFSNFWDPTYEYITGTWFDNVDSLDPCHLCWWARIMMFPILPLMITYAFTKARPILWYVFLVTIPGIFLELFHYILQKPQIIGRDFIDNPFWCTAANPCAAVDVDYFGIFTIPFLCLMAFVFIHIVVGFLLFSKKVVNRAKKV